MTGAKQKQQRLDEVNKRIAELEAKLKDLKKDDKVELATGIMTKLFTEFAKAGKWLNWTKEFAKANYYTYSPLGFRRNLFGIMTDIPAIVNGMGRRAANSPIQGIASQIGITAAYLIACEVLKVARKFGYMDKNSKVLIAEVLKAVHDANYTETPYEFVIPMIYIVQWCATYGVTDYYRRVYKFEFTIEPEIELELGATEDASYGWDWTDNHLTTIINKTLDDQVEIKQIDQKGRAEAYEKIMSAFKNKELMEYLNTNYPILNQPKYGLRLKGKS